MKTISAIVLLVSLVAHLPFLAADPIEFKGEEAYWSGKKCGFDGKSFLFQIVKDGETHDICCPPHTLPTGNIDPKFQMCAVFQPARGDCSQKDAEVSYCASLTPFKLCCPANQIGLCEPDRNKQQCVVNPFDTFQVSFADGVCAYDTIYTSTEAASSAAQ
jgi:hypothetical protein